MLGRAARTWASGAKTSAAVLAVVVLAAVGAAPAHAQTAAAPAPPSVVAVDAATPGRLTLDVVVPRTGTGGTLGVAAFEVTPGTIDTVAERAPDQLDVVLVVDDRRTIGAIGLANVKEVTRQLVAGLRTGTTLAINTVGGEGGLPTKDLPAAGQFVDSLVLSDVPAASTPARALQRIAGLLQPGAGRTTHVVVVAGDGAAVRASDEAALRTLLAAAKADLSVVSVARRVDPSIAAFVAAPGVAVADGGSGLSLLAPRVLPALTSRYTVAVSGATGRTATLRVRASGASSDPVEFRTDGSSPAPAPPSTATASPSTAAQTATTTAATALTATTAGTATASGAPATGATATTVASGGGTASTNAARPTSTARSVTAVTPADITAAPRGTGGSSRVRRLLITLAAAGVIGGIGSVLLRARHPRGRAHRNPWVEFDTLRMSTDSDDVWRGGRELRLDRNEREVLRAMTARPGHIFSRDDIAQIAWPERDTVSPRLVSTLMDHLQRTVDGLDDVPLVHGVRGAGYVLSDPADTEGTIAGAVRPRAPQYSAPAHRRASRR